MTRSPTATVHLRREIVRTSWKRCQRTSVKAPDDKSRTSAVSARPMTASTTVVLDCEHQLSIDFCVRRDIDLLHCRKQSGVGLLPKCAGEIEMIGGLSPGADPLHQRF